MKTLHTYISEKLVINKNSGQNNVNFHPNYDELQKKTPKEKFDDYSLYDSFLNYFEQCDKDNTNCFFDPAFNFITTKKQTKAFHEALKEFNSLHQVCYILNNSMSDEAGVSGDNRWVFYNGLSDWYYDMTEQEYLYEDLEHYIIYNDKKLTNVLLTTYAKYFDR